MHIYYYMKKLFFGLIIVFTFLIASAPAFAVTDFGREVRETIRNRVEEGKGEGSSPAAIRQEVRENIREQVQERNEGLLDRVKNLVRKNLRFNARITGTIASIGTGTMTVTGDDGETYEVNISEETRLVRRFGGKGELSEFSIGNKVNVFGRFTDEEQLTIDARLIRNLSVQKRWGVFFGEVTAENSGNFVMETIQRGDLTVYYDAETKFFDHEKETIASGDIEVGMRVRVKGVWDKSLDKITEVDEVRLFK